MSPTYLLVVYQVYYSYMDRTYICVVPSRHRELDGSSANLPADNYVLPRIMIMCQIICFATTRSVEIDQIAS